MNKLNENIYALYRGDEFVALGTLREISEQTGHTIQMLYKFKAPSYLKRQTCGNRLELVKVEDDD